MENWEQHIHLTIGHCFEMYFKMFGQIIKFKVIGQDNFGTKKAKKCGTGEIFEFNVNSLLKLEYSTLQEIDCNNC